MDRPNFVWTEAAGVFVLALAGIFLARYDVMFSPPWQDQAIGYWLEADYLAQSGFDYFRLRYEENHYLDMPSGARSYVVSLVPAFVALLMATLSPPCVIFTVRLFSFLCGAAILALVFLVIRQRLSRIQAALVVAALGTTPMFITQIEIMGMDVPLGLAVMITLVLLLRGNYVLAACASFLAFLMKATGQLATLSTIVYLAGLIVVVEKKERRRVAVGLAIGLLSLVVESALLAWGDTTFALRWMADWPDSLRMPQAMLITTPDALALIVLTLAVTGCALLHAWRRRSDGPVGSTVAKLLAKRPMIFAWLFVTGLLASAWTYIYIPRYLFSGLPLIYVALAFSLFYFTRLQRVAACLLVLIIGWNVVNYDGRFYPDVRSAAAADLNRIASLTDRSCMYTERSREYLRDHQANLETIAFLKHNYADRTLVVAPPYYFLLTRPSMGYVDRAFPAIDPTLFEAALRALCRADEAQDAPLLSWYGQSRLTLPAPRTEDIIYHDGMPTPFIVYEKPQPLRAQRCEEWFLDATWNLDWANERLRARWPYLVASGRAPRALDEVNQAIAKIPEDPDLLTIREEILAASNDRSTTLMLRE